MKTVKNLSLIAVIALIIVSCKNDKQPEVKTVDVEITENDVAQNVNLNATYAKVEFGIDGMTCAMGCAKTIEKKMAKMEGVKTAKVDFDKRLAMVEYDEAKVSLKSLEEAVAKVGEMYKVKEMKMVDTFGEDKEKCKADCKKACCTDDAKAADKACTKDCDKACCKEMKAE